MVLFMERSSKDISVKCLTKSQAAEFCCDHGLLQRYGFMGRNLCNMVEPND